MSNIVTGYKIGCELARNTFFEKTAIPEGWASGPSKPIPKAYKPTSPSSLLDANPSYKDDETGKFHPHPSRNQIRSSVGELPLGKLNRGVQKMKSMHTPYQHRILKEELNNRLATGSSGNYSRDFSTMQGDVNKFRDDVAAYHPPIRTPSTNPKSRVRQPTRNSDEPLRDIETEPNYPRASLREHRKNMGAEGPHSNDYGYQLGRHPAHVVRPNSIKFIGGGSATQPERPTYSIPQYDPNIVDTNDNLNTSNSFNMDTTAVTPTGGWHWSQDSDFSKDEGDDKRRSHYKLTSEAHPKYQDRPYANPITASHEYAHGEYGMDEVEADALAATSDYNMWDLANFYNGLVDYGKSDHETEISHKDHEERNDTHLTIPERMSMLAPMVQ